MNVTVFGATGAVGQLVVAGLLAREDAVTAYVRSPDKVPGEWAGRVRVLVGELDDTAQIDAAVTGADAVVSALGPVLGGPIFAAPLVSGTRGIVAAAEHAGVRRFVGLATPSARDPRDRFSLPAAALVRLVRVGLPEAYAAIVGMTDAVTSSSLDWTIVRFLRLVDGPAHGVRRVGPVGSGVRPSITRADVAGFVVTQLTHREWVHRMPQISN